MRRHCWRWQTRDVAEGRTARVKIMIAIKRVSELVMRRLLGLRAVHPYKHKANERSAWGKGQNNKHGFEHCPPNQSTSKAKTYTGAKKNSPCMRDTLKKTCVAMAATSTVGARLRTWPDDVVPPQRFAEADGSMNRSSGTVQRPDRVSGKRGGNNSYNPSEQQRPDGQHGCECTTASNNKRNDSLSTLPCPSTPQDRTAEHETVPFGHPSLTMFRLPRKAFPAGRRDAWCCHEGNQQQQSSSSLSPSHDEIHNDRQLRQCAQGRISCFIGWLHLPI